MWIVVTYSRFLAIAGQKRFVIVKTIPSPIVNHGKLFCITVSDGIELALVTKSLLPEKIVGDFSYLKEYFYQLFFLVIQIVYKVGFQFYLSILLNFCFHRRFLLLGTARKQC